jgi:hypothetical protein
MPEKIPHGVERHAALDQARGKEMAHVVPAKSGDPGTLEKRSPSGLEIGGDIEHARFVSGLVLPVARKLVASSFSGT